MDWDVGEVDAGHPDVVSILDPVGRDQNVYVTWLTVRPFAKLPGTDFEAALEAGDFVG